MNSYKKYKKSNKRSKHQRRNSLKTCWNCFRSGHLRFQCPLPKLNSCSFCYTPGVRSCDCKCESASRHFGVPIPLVKNNISVEIGSYQNNVLVPIGNEDGQYNYQNMDNIVVFVDNIEKDAQKEEDRDIIDIHPEIDDFLFLL